MVYEQNPAAGRKDSTLSIYLKDGTFIENADMMNSPFDERFRIVSYVDKQMKVHFIPMDRVKEVIVT